MADFLDRLKKGIDKGVTTVTVRSKELIELTQLRGQVNSLEEEKRRGLEELGSIVYTLFTQARLEEDQERVKAKCARLAAIDQKIGETEEEIRRVQIRANEALGGGGGAGVAMCECGAPIPEGAKFCGGCGRRVAAKQP